MCCCPQPVISGCGRFAPFRTIEDGKGVSSPFLAFRGMRRLPSGEHLSVKNLFKYAATMNFFLFYKGMYAFYVPLLDFYVVGGVACKS